MALFTLNCPKCGQTGQAKFRKRYHQIYLEIDHYGKPFYEKGLSKSQQIPANDKNFTTHHYTYKSTCYIGNIDKITLDTQLPYTIDKRLLKIFQDQKPKPKAILSTPFLYSLK
jgi:hypothetical protein